MKTAPNNPPFARCLCALLLAAALAPRVPGQPTGRPSEAGPAGLAQNAGPGIAAQAPAAVVTQALGRLLGGAGEAPQTAAAPQSGSPRPSGFVIPLTAAGDHPPVRLEDRDGLISLAVRDTPLRHVLAMIAEARRLNLVFAASTDVPVTATLDRLPIDQALDSLLAASGYTWARQGRVIFVTSLAGGGHLPPSVQDRRVAVFELDFASAIDVDQAVKGLLSPAGQSWVIESSPADNRRTSETIVVEDLAPYVARIEGYIGRADQPPRQVLISAHILEVDLSRDKRAGVDLSAIANMSGASLSVRAPGLANASASPAFIIEANGGDLSPVIEALITTTDAKTLAAPRVLAINGQQARIQIGEQLGFRVTTTTETSTLESVENLDVGVVLAVTPRITRDGRVMMRVQPEVSSGSVNPDTGLPEKETAEVETDVLLSSGQGIVIGGLIQERDSTSINRTPVLGSLPYAGFFFQRRQVVKRRSEIIVALVPHVLPYSPMVHARDAESYCRATTPLTYGPLCRHPRPFEPRLQDVMAEHPMPLCSRNQSACCPPPSPRCIEPLRAPAAATPTATGATHPRVAAAGLVPRRLPPITKTERRPISAAKPLFAAPAVLDRPAPRRGRRP